MAGVQVQTHHHPRPFSGSADEDIYERLGSFDVVAFANDWKPEDALRRYSVYLTGAVRAWYDAQTKLKATFGAAKPDLFNYERQMGQVIMSLLSFSTN